MATTAPVVISEPELPEAEAPIQPPMEVATSAPIILNNPVQPIVDDEAPVSEPPATERIIPLHTEPEAVAAVSVRSEPPPSRPPPSVRSRPPLETPVVPMERASASMVMAAVGTLIAVGVVIALMLREPALVPDPIPTAKKSAARNSSAEASGATTASASSSAARRTSATTSAQVRKSRVAPVASGDAAKVDTEAYLYQLLQKHQPAVGSQFLVSDWKDVHEELFRSADSKDPDKIPVNVAVKKRVITYALWAADPYRTDVARASTAELQEAYAMEFQQVTWSSLGSYLQRTRAAPSDGGAP